MTKRLLILFLLSLSLSVTAEEAQRVTPKSRYRQALKAYRAAIDSMRAKESERANEVEAFLSRYEARVFHRHLSVRTKTYEKATRILELEGAPLRLWNSLKDAHGFIGGKEISFKMGETTAVLPFRIFQKKPYMKQYDWALSFGPEDIFSYDGEDYILVRFAYIDNLEGHPATTEERALFRIVKKELREVVPLHNFLPTEKPRLEKGRLILEGRDGLSYQVKFVIDLNDLTICRALSIVSNDFNLEYGDIVPMK